MAKFSLVSLGCPKNTVSSEEMVYSLKRAGFEFTLEEENAEYIFVNTCAFIHKATAESIQTILELSRYKKGGKLKKLVVVGCLPQRYGEELKPLLAEVDLFWAGADFSRLAKLLKHQKAQAERIEAKPLCRTLLTPNFWAYLKIAEGCNHSCAFCTIPLIKGRYQSRKLEDILAEASRLAESGVKELSLIAQDTTYYGLDLYKKRALPELLSGLCRIPGLAWVRLLYAHPEGVNEELLTVMAKEEKICPYLDLPLQHSSPQVLKAMGRTGGAKPYLELISFIRERVPGIVLRSTFMVGHPGEGEKEFAELANFLKAARLEKVGVFLYSREEGTCSAGLSPRVSYPQRLKRRKILLSLQQQVSCRFNRQLRGKSIEVLVEGAVENFTVKEPRLRGWLKECKFYGRSIFDAPQIDGGVFIKGKAHPGELFKARILDSSIYDLLGTREKGGEIKKS